MARTLRAVPELMTILLGLMAGIRSVVITLSLLLMITYVFAIVFRQLTDETELGSIHFPSIPGSCYSLLIEGMMPDNAAMMGELGDDSWVLGTVFFFFIFLAALTIMNMLIGILCDVVQRVSESEKDRSELEDMTMKISEMLKVIDQNFDGYISKAEFGELMANAETMKALHRVGVDVLALIDDVDGIFEQLPGTRLPVTEFADVVSQFRANHAATTRSIAGLRKMLRNQTEKIMKQMDEIHEVVREFKPIGDGPGLLSVGLRSDVSSRPFENCRHPVPEISFENFINPARQRSSVANSSSPLSRAGRHDADLDPIGQLEVVS
eukprot:CAMPEP_0170620520 /NCGR_PEP_ID=MMETSP0224-20130122/28103_1 /TAXON_ID=285029 /ORGANISM="Togula jolla, Strain CCCM 725" /LENGTH=322 /DNA_ID=CAMNT_0010946701 /DNA_START=275 /DNA_END=1240 /DNA_ORIENTATION=-